LQVPLSHGDDDVVQIFHGDDDVVQLSQGDDDVQLSHGDDETPEHDALLLFRAVFSINRVR